MMAWCWAIAKQKPNGIGSWSKSGGRKNPSKRIKVEASPTISDVQQLYSVDSNGKAFCRLRRVNDWQVLLMNIPPFRYLTPLFTLPRSRWRNSRKYKNGRLTSFSKHLAYANVQRSACALKRAFNMFSEANLPALVCLPHVNQSVRPLIDNSINEPSADPCGFGFRHDICIRRCST